MRLYLLQQKKPALLHTGTLHVCRLLVLSIKAMDYLCRVPSEFLSRRLYLSNRPHFLWAYRSDNPSGIVENTNKACKSWAEGEWFTSFSSVLTTSQVGYHAGWTSRTGWTSRRAFPYITLLSASFPPSSACALIFQMNRIKISPRWVSSIMQRIFKAVAVLAQNQFFWFGFSQDIMATWRHVLLQQVSGNSTFLTKKKSYLVPIFLFIIFFWHRCRRDRHGHHVQVFAMVVVFTVFHRFVVVFVVVVGSMSSWSLCSLALCRCICPV